MFQSVTGLTWLFFRCRFCRCFNYWKINHISSILMRKLFIFVRTVQLSRLNFFSRKKEVSEWVFNALLNIWGHIGWSVLLAEETKVTEGNCRPSVRNWQISSHKNAVVGGLWSQEGCFNHIFQRGPDRSKWTSFRPGQVALRLEPSTRDTIAIPPDKDVRPSNWVI